MSKRANDNSNEDDWFINKGDLSPGIAYASKAKQDSPVCAGLDPTVEGVSVKASTLR